MVLYDTGTVTLTTDEALDLYGPGEVAAANAGDSLVLTRQVVPDPEEDL